MGILVITVIRITQELMVQWACVAAVLMCGWRCHLLRQAAGRQRGGAPSNLVPVVNKSAGGGGSRSQGVGTQAEVCGTCRRQRSPILADWEAAGSSWRREQSGSGSPGSPNASS